MTMKDLTILAREGNDEIQKLEDVDVEEVKVLNVNDPGGKVGSVPHMSARSINRMVRAI